MVEDIYDPLTEYANVFRNRFKEVAEQTFAELAAEAKVDEAANKETCRQVYATESALSSAKTRVALLWVWLTILCCGGTVLAVVALIYETMPHWFYITAAVAVPLIILYIFIDVHPRLRKVQKKRDTLATTLAQLKDEAWQQMQPLNRLYDWDVLTRMMSKTVPRLEFDPYFTTQRLADLQEVYHWDDSFNDERSVIYSHSGLINGNPFVLCRTRKMNMGKKTYYGSKHISWTTTERGSDGKYHTVHHSQTLTASYTAPYPEYFEKTRLIYGNTAAPDLTFTRKQSGLASEIGSFAFRMERRALRKKAKKLTNSDFAMMTNEDFEVAFNTSDRNSNQQFALLFTPLAQESMLKLLQDNAMGYGDDFDFNKLRMINVVIPKHLQKLNLDLNPDLYRKFDYEEAKKTFKQVNARYFRAIYFSLAPLLCIPMYQQIRPQHDIYGRDMQRHSAFWEHEALANFWGQDQFKHPSCVTDCILKTSQAHEDGDSSSISVAAHGYRTERRIAYIPRFGGDGRTHNVPVEWDEYIPITGYGNIRIKEDNTPLGADATYRQRAEHISQVVGSAGSDIYRRHIASHLQ